MSISQSSEEEAIEFSWARQTARRIGTVVHEALERFGRDSPPGPGHWPALTLRLESRLQALGVAGDAAREGAERALEALQRVLADERGRWLFDATHREAHSELAITGLRDGDIVNAVIDRTFVTSDGIRWVVDYKTSRTAPTDDDARTSLPLALYAAAAWKMFRRRCVRVELHHLPSGTVAAHEHTGESLARKIAEHAYRAGAGLVTTIFSDEEMTLARYRYGHDLSFDRAPGWLYEGVAKAFDENTARLAISGDNPMLLGKEDPEKVGRANRANSKAYRPALAKIVGHDINWSIVPYPGASWAKEVFPGEPEEVAVNPRARSARLRVFQAADAS